MKVSFEDLKAIAQPPVADAARLIIDKANDEAMAS
tara:strand:+ start:90 stop:194 length:105 start_codon:yes stop_codon:yes gene_type:complete